METTKETILKTVKIGENVVTQTLGTAHRQDIGYRLNGKRVSVAYLMERIPNVFEVLNGRKVK